MDQYKHKLVLVDDIQFHLLSTKERFRAKYDIYTAQSSVELFDILSSVLVSAILLDINMPEEDGFEILKKLKDSEFYAHVPVIFLSAKINRDVIIKGMSHGAADFIPKPFSDLEFIDSIERCVHPERYSANKPVILAVDDNPAELQTIHFFLKDKYTVYTLPDPGRINDLLTMITPDLILLDCQMPVVSGFDLVPIIRNIANHEETPIIFVTALGSIDNISVAMHLGACDFVVKPIDELTLNEKVAQHLSEYVMRRRIRDFTPR
ncbi:MAG: response regulator [Oscillospiraceae bacterium]|nr:response regulator [Oscillospiraceae bacterium]